MNQALVEVAVFAPLRQTFYYTAPSGLTTHDLQPGQCVRVPFGNSSRIGVVLGSVSSPESINARIKPIETVLETIPTLSEIDLALAKWAANYYHHPLGDVIASTIPTLFRRGKSYQAPISTVWKLNPSACTENIPARAKRQRQLIILLTERPYKESEFKKLDFDWRRPLNDLAARGFLLKVQTVDDRHGKLPSLVREEARDPLNMQQQLAVDEVANGEGYQAFLLYGVTGSGKTNVYMEVIARLTQHGGQALVLLPEIAITQHLVDRFARRFSGEIRVLHSGLTDKERAGAWLDFADGTAHVLLGTRSAVWAKSANLRCIIVDEEHDPSFKQQEGFRYSARDVAVVRANRLSIPIIMGTATPSFESYQNVKNSKYRLLSLTERAGGASLPAFRVEDVRGMNLVGGLSPALLQAITQRLQRNEQIILFLNRRGYAPVMLCHSCGEVMECDRCDSKLVFHREKQLYVCHQCDKRVRVENVQKCCDKQELVSIGQGTEQLEESLRSLFPSANVARVDRDVVRKKSELDAILKRVNAGDLDILLGTQMLAKGHDFSQVTLVGIVDADARLFSLDFRAEERLAQLIIQVAGRAGRANLPGEVYIQTRQPFHWLFDTLINKTYDQFIERGLNERQAAGLPPFTYTALLRAEAVQDELPYQFLRKILTKERATPQAEVEIFGPVPSAIERRAGKYRAELLFSAVTHGALAQSIRRVVKAIAALPERNRVRWAIDVDPQDI